MYNVKFSFPCVLIFFKFKKYLFYYFMCVNILSTCLYVDTCMPGAQGSQKRALDSLQLSCINKS